jgi:hypothetical protein
LEVKQEIAGVGCGNTFYFRESTVYALDDVCRTISVDFLGHHIRNLWVKILSQDVNFCSVACWAVKPRVAVPTNLYLSDDVGENSGAAMPTNAVAMLQWMQETTTSASNGQSLLSGFRETDSNGNDFAYAGAQADIDNFIAAMVAGIDAGGVPANGHWDLVIRSTSGPSGGTPTTPVYLPVVSGEFRSILYNQKRRTRKHDAVSP